MTDASTTLTIMFTDMVGSTALGARLGDVEAKTLRRAHDRILHEQFERFEGRVVESTGDGFLVTFGTAGQGVKCAVEIQRAIAAVHADGHYSDLQVRIGLHTGEPVAERDQLFGSDMNLAARVMAEAGGGQVFVSEVTRLLARSTLGREGSALEFAPGGERNLKGFDEPVPVFEVRWPENEAARPRFTRFVGRGEETTELRRLLEEALAGHGGVALVGGEPGVGKTRLASETAAYAQDRGFQVLTGRSYEAEGMPPYLPFTEALGQYVRSVTADELRSQLNGNAPYVARILPELRRILPGTGDVAAMGPDSERHLLFQGVSDFILEVASRKPLVLSFDDLQWADSAALNRITAHDHRARRWQSSH